MASFSQKQTATASTLDAGEVARFAAIAEEWWDPHGKFAPLHRLNPTRLQFIRDHALAHFFGDTGHGVRDTDSKNSLRALAGLEALDIGCGGGLVAEPLARMGATVLGIDAAERNVQVARQHAAQKGVAVEYRATTAEELAGLAGNGSSPPLREGEFSVSETEITQYDLVLALEIIEHVADVPLFLESCAALVKPGGLLVMSTLNRTAKAYALAIVGAEYVLRWLPRGTHDWNKFLKPHELIMPLQAEGLELVEMRGLVLNPLTGRWSLSEKDLDVNYMAVLRK